MKLLVFADTHGSSEKMLDVVANETEVYACIHLGDGVADAEKLEEAFPSLRVYRVRGNCDYAGFDPESGLVPFGGVLFFYTHGHNYGVKQGLASLWRTARSQGANAALFGHTHTPDYEVRGGIHLFNPGSLTSPRGAGPTYGRVTIQNETPFFEIRPFEALRRPGYNITGP